MTVIEKRQREEDHTVLAAGVINSALGNVDPEGSRQQYFADTILEGYELSEPRMAPLMTKESSEIIQEIDGWGADFTKLDKGKRAGKYAAERSLNRQ